jgi:spore coat polysaccharide biosynthesis protein SpsF
MPYLYEPATSNQQLPGGSLSATFRVLVVNHDVDYGHLRWTVDTAEDLELVRQIYAHFPGRGDFTWLDVLEMVQHHPELGQINADVQHKTLRDVDERGAA